jgi:CheY-like chemotaxis protein
MYLSLKERRQRTVNRAKRKATAKVTKPRIFCQSNGGAEINNSSAANIYATCGIRRVWGKKRVSLPIMAVKHKLVLIDDEPGVLRALNLLLTAMQYEVSPFSSPSEALKFIGSTPEIDLVVTDLRMPEVTGEGVLREIRRMSKPIPVIVMSGHATRADLAPLEALGLDAFVSKPFTPSQFAKAIDSALSRRLRATA